MKPTTIFALVGQLALAMATVNPKQESTRPMHAASHRLDGSVSNILNETPANRASACSVAPTTTVCKTETSTITQTLTVTALSSLPVGPPVTAVSPTNPSPPLSYPVSASPSSELHSSFVSSVVASTTAPIVPVSTSVVPPHSGHLTVTSGSSSAWSTTWSVPYPIHNSTLSATGTAPHSSGTGVVTPSTSAPLTAPTNGADKTAINGLAAAVFAIGGVFLSL
ncbi:hypothetical protein GRF29_77g1017034 [Pseudopithomyces chartarum]|uniref:Uncharacterized protein n=1 Tax=Pseudopithomyces chartarum TaxID=1892770 RepID=A0AAN6LYL1_9PLEO|nr:hypothetical protein GRF29_77g1017034 [Pseudopithomyces chartarum]